MSGQTLQNIWENAVYPPPYWTGDLSFTNLKGQKIRYGYAPALGEQKGTIVLTHGYAESIDLYYETIKKYQSLGYEVWGMDWQGHGKSERSDPRHPLIPSDEGMGRHIDDLNFFVNNIVKPRSRNDRPLIMSTHSMGGHIGLLYLKMHPHDFDGAVMSAPMFDIYRLGLGTWARPGVRLLFNTASALGYEKTPVPTLENLTSSLGRAGRVVESLLKQDMSPRGEIRSMLKELSPQAQLGRPTFGWIANAYNTIVPSLSEDFLQQIETPVLIGSASYDDLVDNAAHKRAAEHMPNATNVYIPEADHGLWFEDDGAYDLWWSHIENFLGAIRPEPKSENGPALLSYHQGAAQQTPA